MMASPVHILLPIFGPRIPLQKTIEAGCNRSNRGQGIVEFVAKDSNQALPDLPFLFAQGAREIGKHQKLMRQPVEPEAGSPQLPATIASCESYFQQPRFLGFQAIVEPQLDGVASDEAGGWASQQPFAGTIDQPENLVRIPVKLSTQSRDDVQTPERSDAGVVE
jgi:hypothetical protein